MSDRFQSILLFGAPGVGKGTQGKVLGCIPGMRHMATGDIFRALDKQSDLGRKFIEYSSRGELVPDDLTIEVWRRHVEELIAACKYRPRTDLLVLDGIPRSRAQAQAIDPYIKVLAILHLASDSIDEMIRRMKRRATLEKRHDDGDENVIRRRFAVYEAETRPVLEHYPAALVREIDAIGSPVEVTRRVLDALVPVYNANYDNPLA